MNLATGPPGVGRDIGRLMGRGQVNRTGRSRKSLAQKVGGVAPPVRHVSEDAFLMLDDRELAWEGLLLQAFPATEPTPEGPAPVAWGYIAIHPPGLMN